MLLLRQSKLRPVAVPGSGFKLRVSGLVLPFVRKCICIYVFAERPVCMCVCMCMYIYCICICIYIYVYSYAYKHIGNTSALVSEVQFSFSSSFSIWALIM